MDSNRSLGLVVHTLYISGTLHHEQTSSLSNIPVDFLPGTSQTSTSEQAACQLSSFDTTEVLPSENCYAPAHSMRNNSRLANNRPSLGQMLAASYWTSLVFLLAPGDLPTIILAGA
jgi:hypothetical protein